MKGVILLLSFSAHLSLIYRRAADLKKKKAVFNQGENKSVFFKFYSALEFQNWLR